MKRIRKWIRYVFGFSRSETNGFIVLLPLLMMILVAEPVYRWYLSRKERDYTADIQILDSLIAHWDDQTIIRQQDSGSVPPTAQFVFNPNTATPHQLQALGFSKALATRIVTYRTKGGRFRVKSDLLKIYGVDSALVHSLHAFIDLPESLKAEGAAPKNVLPANARVPMTRFDLNEADTAMLKKINGIGEKLAVRIVRYRDKLGGFISLQQVSEVYGLDSIVVKRLTATSFIEENFNPQMLNINTMTETDLASHPYISKSMANAIVMYRFQHGKFTGPEDIRKINRISSPEAERIIPYLKAGE